MFHRLQCVHDKAVWSHSFECETMSWNDVPEFSLFVHVQRIQCVCKYRHISAHGTWSSQDGLANKFSSKQKQNKKKKKKERKKEKRLYSSDGQMNIKHKLPVLIQNTLSPTHNWTWGIRNLLILQPPIPQPNPKLSHRRQNEMERLTEDDIRATKSLPSQWNQETLNRSC